MIIVSVVGSDGNLIPPPARWRPPKDCAAIVKELRRAGHGAGLMLDKDGFTVQQDDPPDMMEAGNYTYHLTPVPAAGRQRLAAPNAQPGDFVGERSEGLRARPRHTPRRKTCVQVLELVNQRGLVTLKAQPRSGKTSLLQLCARLVEKGEMLNLFSGVVYVNCAGMPADMSWEDFFKLVTAEGTAEGLDWSKLVTKASSTAAISAAMAQQQGLGAGGRGSSSGGSSSSSIGAARGVIFPANADPTLPLLVEIDEISSTYSRWQSGKFDGLLNFIKQVLGAEQLGVRILAASVYGGAPSHMSNILSGDIRTATPFDHVETVSFEPSPTVQVGMKLLSAEHEELWGITWSSFKSPEPVFADNSTRDHVYYLTGGMVGVVVDITDKLEAKLKAQQQDDVAYKAALAQCLPNEGLGDAAYRRLLTTGEVYSALQNNRSFLNVEQLSASALLQTGVLNPLLTAGDEGALTDNLSAEAQALLRKMHSLGLIRVYEQGGWSYYSLFSELHRLYYQHQLLTLRVQAVDHADSPTSLRHLVLASFQRVSKGELLETLSLSVDKMTMLERKIQDVFSTAARSVLPRSYRVCPDVGKVFGSSGMVDLWVSWPTSESGWAIEFLLNGVDLREHEKRFEPGGKYFSLPTDAVMVVDFRQPGSAQPRPRASDFTYFVIFPKPQPGQPAQYDGAQLVKADTQERWDLPMAP